MTLPQEGYLLRIFIGENDKHRGKALYEWIVSEARARGLAGATVLRGIMGFGANSRVIHTFKIERLSEDLPIVVEIVDTREKLEQFLREIEPEIGAGLATLEKVEVRFYRSQSGDTRKVEAG
jgi:PII-like signaling protein